jgi:serine protease Do
VDQDTSQLYGLPQGVLVRDVMPGSCAEKAGMRSQDIIIDLGGNEVKNLNGLSRALNKCKAGQEVIVTVYRSGREMELTVILDERPQDESSQPQATEPATESYNPWPDDDFFNDWFGQFFG